MIDSVIKKIILLICFFLISLPLNAQNFLLKPGGVYDFTMEKNIPFLLENPFGPTINVRCLTDTPDYKNIVYIKVHNGACIVDGHWLKDNAYWYLTVKKGEFHLIKAFRTAHVSFVNRGRSTINVKCKPVQ